MSALLTLLVLLPIAQNDDPVFSGPQAGEKLAALPFTSTAGKTAEQKLDLMAEAKNKPVVVVFMHQKNRPAFALARTVMQLAENRGPEKITGGFIYLDDDQTAANQWMSQIGPRYFPKGIHMGVSVDGAEGPGAWGLNREVAMTVVVGKDGKATANFALVQPSVQSDGPKIFAAIGKALGEKKAPQLSEVAGDRRMMAQNQRRDQVSDADFRAMMAPLIQAKTDEAVDAAAKKIEAEAAKNPALKTRLGDTARRIVGSDVAGRYGIKKCREYLKKWAKEYKAPAGRRPQADGPQRKRPARDAATDDQAESQTRDR